MLRKKPIAAIVLACGIGLCLVSLSTNAQERRPSSAATNAPSRAEASSSATNQPGGEPSKTARRARAAGAATSAVLFAVVNEDGTLDRGNGVSFSQRLADGRYEVIFDRQVWGGAFVATVGNPHFGDPTGGEIAVAERVTDPNGVWVQTFDSAGAEVSKSFYLVVHP